MESIRPGHPVPRRVVTAPMATPASRSTSTGGLVETLYNHPNIKIVAFTAISRGRTRSPARAPVDETGTLSAHSQLERTIAIGPFRIYRTGSVAFLSCGSALQPMLPKSQCWALEEDGSKFVLQIRRPNYWRIEIPVTEPFEVELAAAFKGVLEQILQFEKTECPFKRSFTVTLPEKPKTPVKKRPWTPPVKRALPVLSTPAHEVSPVQRAPTPKLNRRASTSSPVRGRSEQRRFSVIGTEFHLGSESRGTSIETSKSFDPRRDQNPRIETSAILEKAERENSVDSNIFAIQEAPAAHTTGADEVANADMGKFNKSQIELRSGDSVVENVKSKELTQAEPALAAGNEPPELVISKGWGPSLDSKQLESAAVVLGHSQDPQESESEASTNMTANSKIPVPVPAPSNGADVREEASRSSGIFSTSGRAMDENSVFMRNNSDVRKLPRSLLVPTTKSTGSAAQPEIKEQLVIVEMAPKTSSSIEAGTPTPTNIYDVIRNYEKKMATSASGTAPAVDGVGAVPDVPEAAAGEAIEGLSHGIQSGSDGEGDSCEILEGNGVVAARRKKLRGFRAGRALVPPPLTLVTSPPSKSTTRQNLTSQEVEEPKDAGSPTGSSDSFHSVQSWHSPVTPVPRSPVSDVSPTRFPYPHDNIVISKKPWHYRDVSDMTITPETRRTWDATSSLTDDSSQESAATAPDMVLGAREQPDKTALSEDDAATVATTRRPYLRHRATTSSISVGRNALSSLPSAANLFAPTAASTRQQPFLRSQLDIVRRIPMAIVSKTCEVLLGPPSHLITLMLQVAAKIAAGQWRGMMFGHGEAGETIPVQWDYSDDEYSSWGEDDDYYLSQVESSRANSVIGNEDLNNEVYENPNETRRGWEVD